MAANRIASDSSFVQMVILTDDHRKAPLTQTEANEIEKYIFNQVCDNHGRPPRFKGKYVLSKEDGAVIINTHVDSVRWLREVIRSYKEKVLTVTDVKNGPQYTAKVSANVTKLDSKAVDNLLDLLETHNVGLQTDGWRILRTYQKVTGLRHRGTYAMILIDAPGMKMLEENGFELDLGFSTLTFQLLGRVKRSETTGEICDDNIQSQQD